MCKALQKQPKLYKFTTATTVNINPMPTKYILKSCKKYILKELKKTAKTTGIKNRKNWQHQQLIIHLGLAIVLTNVYQIHDYCPPHPTLACTFLWHQVDTAPGGGLPPGLFLPRLRIAQLSRTVSTIWVFVGTLVACSMSHGHAFNSGTNISKVIQRWCLKGEQTSSLNPNAGRRRVYGNM